MKPIERLYQYFENKDIKPTRFEKDYDISNGYFSTQLKRNADLGGGILEKIINNCRDLNIEWLLTGNGEMLKGNNQPISLVQEQKPIYVTRKQTGNDDIVDKLLNRLEQQSEEIGKLKTELEIYKRGDIPGAMDAGVAVAN